jgi:hypothetical protein
MKIKILELNNIETPRNGRIENNSHKIYGRNSRTFLHFLNRVNDFKKYDIHFVKEKKDADVYFVGWGSICNMTLEYEESIKCGIEFLKSLDKPFYFFDTNDSVSLYGIFDVFKECPGIKYFKSNYFKNLDLYKNPSTLGRYWWPLVSTLQYKISESDLDILKSKIELANINWLYHGPYSPVKNEKNYKYDAICLVGILKNEEFNYKKNIGCYYNECRLKVFDKIKKLEKYKFKILTTESTGKLKFDEYRSICLHSKVMISPHGFGEINARELDAINYGNIILKQDISHIATNPNVYCDDTCIYYNDDLSNFEEKLVDSIKNFNIHNNKIENIRKKMESSIDNFVLDVVKSL